MPDTENAEARARPPSEPEFARFVRAYLDAYMSGDADAAAGFYASVYFLCAGGVTTVLEGAAIAARLKQLRTATHDRGETAVALARAELRPLDGGLALGRCRLAWSSERAPPREQDVVYLVQRDRDGMRICGVLA